MLTNLVLTIVSDDKPGIVEHIAKAISENQANWLESSFSQLAGKFAGVVRVQTASDNQEQLITSLNALNGSGIHIQIEQCGEEKSSNKTQKTAKFSTVGPDRKGIVREVSQAFAGYGININDLETRLSSMPYSGDPLFEAEGSLSIPDGVDIHELEENLRKVADSLALDFSLNLQG